LKSRNCLGFGKDQNETSHLYDEEQAKVVDENFQSYALQSDFLKEKLSR